MEGAPGGEIDYFTPYGGFMDGGVIYMDEDLIFLGVKTIYTDEHR
jgi:hypothetical protein